MITEGQLQNVISYYFLDLMENKKGTVNVMQPPTHATRDTIQFNKMRANICATVYNIEKYTSTIKVIHNSVLVHQVNSVPKNTICNVDKVQIPLSESGIQLICKHADDNIEHIVLQKKYQKIFISYFKLRHFTEMLQDKIRKFLIEQEWYLPKIYKTDVLLKKLFNSNFVKIIYKDLESLVDNLDGL